MNSGKELSEDEENRYFVKADLYDPEIVSYF